MGGEEEGRGRSRGVGGFRKKDEKGVRLWLQSINSVEKTGLQLSLV